MSGKPTKILAIIPARGGSRGIPRKNIRDFAGKPLLAYAIEEAKESGVDRIVVSTDDEEIAAVAKEYGADVPFLRPAELATAESKITDAVAHLLQELADKENYVPSHILLLQPTSPLRTSGDIRGAIDLFFKRDADSLVSMCRTENVLMTKNADDSLHFENPEMLATPNRQELPTYYKFDGSMIYLVKTTVFLKEKSFLAGKLVGYEIPRWKAVDLDEPQDFVVGEYVYEHRREIEDRIRKFSQEA